MGYKTQRICTLLFAMSEKQLKAAFLKGKVSLLQEEQGRSHREISSSLGVPRSTIFKWKLSNFSLSRKVGSGRPRKTSSQSDERISPFKGFGHYWATNEPKKSIHKHIVLTLNMAVLFFKKLCSFVEEQSIFIAKVGWPLFFVQHCILTFGKV